MRCFFVLLSLAALLLGCDDAEDPPPQRGSVEALLNPPDAERREVVTLTPKAAEMVKQMARDNNMTGEWLLAVSVTPSAGATFLYNLDIEEAIDLGNRLLSGSHGITIAVEQSAEPFLIGTTIDYRETEEGAGFWFDNPNAKDSGVESGVGKKPA